MRSRERRKHVGQGAERQSKEEKRSFYIGREDEQLEHSEKGRGQREHTSKLLLHDRK